jgi:hypothetical protein
MSVPHTPALSSHDVYSFIVIVKQKEDKEHDKANALSAALAVDGGVAGRTKRTIHHVAPFDASPPTPTKKPRKPATPKKETKTSSKPPKNSDEKDIDSHLEQMAHPPTKKSSKSVHVDASGMEQFMLSIDKRLSMFQTQLMELQKCKTSLNLLLTSHVLSFV